MLLNGIPDQRIGLRHSCGKMVYFFALVEIQPGYTKILTAPKLLKCMRVCWKWR